MEVLPSELSICDVWYALGEEALNVHLDVLVLDLAELRRADLSGGMGSPGLEEGLGTKERSNVLRKSRPRSKKIILACGIRWSMNGTGTNSPRA